MKIVKNNLICTVLQTNDYRINTIITRKLKLLVIFEKDFEYDFLCYKIKTAQNTKCCSLYLKSKIKGIKKKRTEL